MLRKKIKYLFLVTMISLMSISVAWAQSATVFRDTAGQWWEQPIAECSAADIVGGRGNGLFAPKDSVTRLESVILLNRALGHRSEADTYSMSQGGYNFPADFPEWGKRNIAFAADKGYISKSGISSMQPKHAASRAEIAVLFANALKLSADGYVLDFADKNAIPASLQPYVAAAVKHGIMVGKTGNKFDPNANVTRGEMAVIIARLFENGKINPNPNNYFVSKVSSIDTVNKKVTVVKGGQTLSYSLATDAICYRNGAKSTISSFKSNENAKLVVDASNKITFLAHTTASPTNSGGNVSITTTYTGTIKGLMSGNPWMLSFQPDTGTLNSYPLISTVKITQNGLTKDLTALTSGARAEIKVSGGSVAEIKLLSTLPTGNEIKGYVVNMYLDYMTVRYDNGTREEINKSTVASNFYQLSRGQRIAMTKVGSIVTSITPLNEPRKLFGEVVSVGSSSITYEDGDGYERAITYASGCRFKDKEGDSIDRDDIKADDAVEIEIDSQEKAVTIKLTDGSSSDLEGEVVELDTSGSWGITIKKPDGTKKTYDVEDDVDVYEDGKSRNFKDIDKGDYVKLKLDRDDDVTRIDIMDIEIVEGEVTDVDTSGSWGITIKKSGGSEKTYDVDKNVKVYEDGKSRKFSDIDKKDYVKLTLNKDDDVISVEIGDDESLEGEVTDIDTSGSLEIEIKLSDGKEKSYDVDKDVDVYKDGRSKEFDDIRKGDYVKLKLDSDDDVTRIDVLEIEVVEGVVTDVDDSGSWEIEIRQSDGREKSYDVNKDVKVYEDGRSKDFDDIRDDDYVKLTIDDDDEVIRIDIMDVEIVEGEVREVDTSGSWGITIKKSNGREEEYSVLKDVKVWEGSRSRDFDDINERDDVKLKINDDDDVFEISILD